MIRKILFPFFKEHHTYLKKRRWFRVLVTIYFVALVVISGLVVYFISQDICSYCDDRGFELMAVFVAVTFWVAVAHYVIQAFFFKVVVDFIVLNKKRKRKPTVSAPLETNQAWEQADEVTEDSSGGGLSLVRIVAGYGLILAGLGLGGFSVVPETPEDMPFLGRAILVMLGVLVVLLTKWYEDRKNSSDTESEDVPQGMEDEPTHPTDLTKQDTESEYDFAPRNIFGFLIVLAILAFLHIATTR